LGIANASRPKAIKALTMVGCSRSGERTGIVGLVVILWGTRVSQKNSSSLLKKVFGAGRHASLIQKSTLHRTIGSRGGPTRFFSFEHIEAVAKSAP
jgi:hypothetical protein